MTLREFVNDAREAVGVLMVSEAAAVAVGLIDKPTAAKVAGVLGVANAAVAYGVRLTRRPGRD